MPFHYSHTFCRLIHSPFFSKELITAYGLPALVVCSTFLFGCLADFRLNQHCCKNYPDKQCDLCEVILHQLHDDLVGVSIVLIYQCTFPLIIVINYNIKYVAVRCTHFEQLYSVLVGFVFHILIQRKAYTKQNDCLIQRQRSARKVDFIRVFNYVFQDFKKSCVHVLQILCNL